MASTPSKAKKPRHKPPTSRPANTSSLSHPAAEVTVSSTPKRHAEEEEPTGPPTKRYSESASVAVRSGIEVGQDATMDDLPETQGELDVDLAELSLGQRLTAISGNSALNGAGSDEEDAEQSAQPPEGPTLRTVPASSLTRTLIQALHSSDSGLLETCLAHTNANLIQNTVKRLPPQLAVPLVTACVERLGRGKRAGKGKGGGAGAGAQRGAGLVRWVRAVLVVHGGHLLTMPDLVARLAGLHATLTARLALQDSLLALNGKLDLVISQIEMRSSVAPAPLPIPKSAKSKGKQKKEQAKQEVSRYVEGESEDEEAEGMEVEVESGDEGGSVEDVELGGSDEDDEEEEVGDSEEENDEEDDDDDVEDDEDDSDEGGGPKLNGFIDNEAEEYTDEEDDEESE